MKEAIAAIITGIATLLGALLATQDGRLILARIFKSKNQGGAPVQRPNLLFRFFLVFLVGAATGGLLFFLVFKEAKEVPYIGGYKLPVGTIAAYMGKVAPEGWLPCNGKGNPADAEHKELIKLIGEKTPDMQGRFLRGLDPTGIIDVDGGKNRALGSPEEDAFKQHTHSVANVLTGGRFNHVGGGLNECAFGTATAGESDPKGSNETRPKNVAVNFIIKY
jgi:hypothetical protein